MTLGARSGLQYLSSSNRRLVVVSNRGPLSHDLASDGSVVVRRSAGGLASAFLSLARHRPFDWVAAAVTAGDQAVARKKGSTLLRPMPSSHPVSVHLVQVPRQKFHWFYNVISNSLLWPLHHYLLDSAQRGRDPLSSSLMAWHRGYAPVNHAFAQAVLDLVGEAADRPIVLLQDYHLFLVASSLRPRLPEAVISHFLHIPWPGPRYWMRLPQTMRQAILQGLGSCDIVGVQTDQDVRNLLDSWELAQQGAVVDRQRGLVITPEERLVTIRAYPISVDVAHLEEATQGAEALRYRRALGRLRRGSLIVRVDRLDPIKDIARGFLAYERLLQEHPELHGRVQFVALLVPSRQEVAAYRRGRKLVERVVDRVNRLFGRQGWRPIIVRMEENFERAVALLQEYDVLVVNSLMDGMNLVAKEGCVLNTRNGVLILSETAGSYQDLAEGVLPVGPADVEGLKEALYQALTMSEEERARRASLLRERVQDRPLSRWLEAQLEDLEAVAQGGL